MKRRQAIIGLAGIGGGSLLGLPASGEPTRAKVLRYAFPAAETGFDPARISDIYSRTVTPHIFESLYQYDHLARPYRIKPRTALALPEVADDHRTWTIRLRPGIDFADDPAFGGRRRELVAADYVYSFKRFFDPAVASPAYAAMADQGIVGLDVLRRRAIEDRQPFDYDTEVEGLRALDRYTLQIRLERPRPRLLYLLASTDLLVAVAREVVQRYGSATPEHPVGTGPFRLAAWRRSSLIVLERNPVYREVLYDAEPNAEDAEGQALLRRFKGRRLPMVDRVEISIIDEEQPRWLAFLNGEHDLLNGVPLSFAELALPNGELAPHLARRGIGLHRVPAPDVRFVYFNIEDPLVGGYTPDKVALRRAIGLALDPMREIRLVRGGEAIPAQGPIAPGTYGYDPALRSTNGEFDLPRARALLDLYGYVDRDGDGWRERPDGTPLELEYATTPDAIGRKYDELWRSQMTALGLRMRFRAQQWPELLKAAQAGRLQIWQVGSTAATPDGHDSYQRYYSRAAGGQNLARFRLPEADRLYERMVELPDGPQRLALFERMNKLAIAYAPYHYNVHRIVSDLTQPWLIGFRRPVFWQDFWQYVDVDAQAQTRGLDAR